MSKRYTFTRPYKDAYEIVDRDIDKALNPEDVAYLLNQQQEQIAELQKQLEEKERFELFGEHCIKDNDINARCQLLDAYKACVVLNEQDKRIKELEETNKVLSNELIKNNIMKQDRLKTCCGIPIYEVPKLKEENELLKLEQKELAIEKLEEVKKILSFDAYNITDNRFDCTRTIILWDDLNSLIDNQVKKLKGENDD